LVARFGSSRSWPRGDRILKVAHAGEVGAVAIYRAQIFAAYLRAPRLLPQLREFADHERRHRAIFAEALALRHGHPCTSRWLCAAGGFALGLVTGLIGERAIAITTVAVERTVLGHLEAWQAELVSTDIAAWAALDEIVQEERDHHAAFMPMSPADEASLLAKVVTLGIQGVIAIGFAV